MQDRTESDSQAWEPARLVEQVADGEVEQTGAVVAAEPTCPHCFAAMAEGATRCASCGVRVGNTKPCAYCWEPIHVNATACPDCGQSLGHILHVPARQGRWYWLRPEYWMERFVHGVRRLAILDILEYASRLAIVVALAGWLMGAGDRREESVLRSWQVLAAADQLGGQQAAIAALENLNCTREREWWEFFPCERVPLQGINLTNYLLTMIDLNGANLMDVNLSGANLALANLSGAYLGYADLSGTNLQSADLSGVNFMRADLSGADFMGADLNRAILSSRNLSGASFIGADLSNVTLRFADLTRVGFEDVGLSGADLWGSDLSNVNLRKVDLSGANLSYVDLSGADLVGADLSGANLWYADLTDGGFADEFGYVAVYDDETIFPIGFDPVAAGLEKREE